MTNELIQAIARAIKSEFECDIYTEKLPQNLEPPCFFILCLNQKEQSKLDVRFLSEHTFVVHYFPKNGYYECWQVLEKLQRLLENIKLNDSVSVTGTNRNGEIRDDVLFFFVNYDFYCKKQKPPAEYMEVLKIYESNRKKQGKEI